MTLHGGFATMPFPDLLQWLGGSRSSGTLWVSLSFEERLFRFDGGDISAMGSADRVAHDLVRLLVGRLLLDEQQLQRVLARTREDPRPLQDIIIDEGYVDRAVLAQAVRTHVQDAVMQVFLWNEGRFVFRSDAEPALMEQTTWDLQVSPALPTEALVMDAMRRVDEWRRSCEEFSSDYTIVHALGPAPDLPVVDALHRIGEPMALVDLCLRLDRPRFQVLDELSRGRKRGLIAVEATPDEIAAPGESPTLRLLDAVRTLMSENQYNEAGALLRTVLNLDPTHAEASDLLSRCQREHLEQLYAEIPPYRTLVVTADRAQLDEIALAPRERYLLDRIDGTRDVASLTVITPLGERESLRTLKKFADMGLVRIT